MRWGVIALALCLWSYRAWAMSNGAVTSTLRINSRQRRVERLVEEPTAQYCLAETIYFEARNQPIEGQLGVAHVVLNRSRESGRSICGVVYEKIGGLCQFSWVCDLRLVRKRKEPEAWEKSQALASEIMTANSVEDPTLGATAFRRYDSHFDRIYNSRLKKTVTIGQHVFFAEK